MSETTADRIARMNEFVRRMNELMLEMAGEGSRIIVPGR